LENDLTLKNLSFSILAQPNQPSPFSFSFSRAWPSPALGSLGLHHPRACGRPLSPLHCALSPPVSAFLLLSFLLPQLSVLHRRRFPFSGHHRWQAIRAVARLWKAANPLLPFLIPHTTRPIKPQADPAFSPHPLPTTESYRRR